MMIRHNWISILLLALSFNLISAQSNELAATVTIIADDVWFIRANTESEFLLAPGAIAPFGIGDTIVTGENGRALILPDENSQILLLPNSRYTIQQFTQTASEIALFQGQLDGIAVHRISETASLEYELETNDFVVNSTEGHFAVWSIDNRLNAVTTASGEVAVQINNSIQTVSSNQGFATPYSEESISLESPLHASQVVGLAINCQGIVNTNGSEGLRLRAGAALDYIVVDLLQDGQTVDIVGTTNNSLWYRIPFQTGFGWIYSSLIDADCDNLEQFPDLVGEDPEQIQSVTETELELLEPFFGIPVNNSVFYR